MMVVVLFVVACSLLDARGAAFDFEQVAGMAKKLAADSFKDHRKPVPRRLKALTYDQVRRITFNPKFSVWRRERLPYQLQFFHPGFIQQDQVRLHLVDGEAVSDLPFSSEMFDYDNLDLGVLDPDEIRFAGFRILHPLNRPDVLDELVVFQGATYFRALGQGHRYGLSARTIAVNTAGDGPEEFPRFRDFWVFRPDSNDPRLKVISLFDSPSLAGAAEFIVKPGVTTTTDCRVALFARTPIDRYGIAPLTSMFFFGENSRNRFDDFRPEVHDSDGILIHNGRGEWLWRPLVNDRGLRTASFADRNPKGFGLLQRDRNFSSYADLEALYNIRPSLWVEPVGEWGPGAIRLVEIPTIEEYNDNIVAYFAPQRALKPGEPARYAYRLYWTTAEVPKPPVGSTVSTRVGAIPGQPLQQRFVLDFAWPNAAADAQGEPPEVVVSAGNAEVLHPVGQFNPYEKTWRASFAVKAAKAGTPVEMRAFIRKGGRTLTETWTYLWIP